MGSGSVGRTVASNTRGPQFELSQNQFFKEHYLLSTANVLSSGHRARLQVQMPIFVTQQIRWKANEHK